MTQCWETGTEGLEKKSVAISQVLKYLGKIMKSQNKFFESRKILEVGKQGLRNWEKIL
jgi:hypothetical protein